MTDEELLKENGWEIECLSPFEIRHEDGSFATKSAAHSVLWELRSSIVLNLELSREDAKWLMECLSRTSARGDALTYGMQLEEELNDFLNKTL